MCIRDSRSAPFRGETSYGMLDELWSRFALRLLGILRWNNLCHKQKYMCLSHINCLSYTITFVHRMQIVDVSQFSSLSQRQRKLRTGSVKTMLKKATFPLVLVHVLEQLSVSRRHYKSRCPSRLFQQQERAGALMHHTSFSPISPFSYHVIP